MIVSGNNDLSGTIPINYDGCVTFPNPFASFMSRMYKKKYAKASENSLEILSLCKWFL